jgi:hypothetical protein
VYLYLFLPPSDADVVEDGAGEDDFPGTFVLGSHLSGFSGWDITFSVEIVLILESLMLNSALAGLTRALCCGMDS